MILEKELNYIAEKCKESDVYLYSSCGIINQLDSCNTKYYKLVKDGEHFYLYNLYIRVFSKNQQSDKKHFFSKLSNHKDLSSFYLKSKCLDDLNFFNTQNLKVNEFRKRNILSCFKLVKVKFEIKDIDFSKTLIPTFYINENLNFSGENLFYTPIRFNTVGLRSDFRDDSDFKNEELKSKISIEFIDSVKQINKNISFEKLFLFFAYYIQNSFNEEDKNMILENYSNEMKLLFQEFDKELNIKYFNKENNSYYLHLNVCFNIKHDIILDLEKQMDIYNFNKLYLSNNQIISSNLLENNELSFISEHINKRFNSSIIEKLYLEMLDSFQNDLKSFTKENVLASLKSLIFEVSDFDEKSVWIKEQKINLDNNESYEKYDLITRFKYAESINFEQLISFMNFFNNLEIVQKKLEQYTNKQKLEQEKSIKENESFKEKIKQEKRKKFESVNKKILKIAKIETVEDFKNKLILSYENNIKKLNRIIYIYEVDENNEDKYSSHYTITITVNTLSKSFSGNYMISVYFDNLGATTNDSLKYKKRLFAEQTNGTMLLSDFNDLYSKVIEKALKDNIKLNIEMYEPLDENADLKNIFKVFCSKVSLSKQV